MIAGHWRVKYYSEPFNPEHPDCPVRHYFHYMTDEDDPVFQAYLRPLIQLNTPSGETVSSSPLRLAERVSKSTRNVLSRCLGVRPLLKDPMALLSADWLARRYHTDTIVLIRHPAAFASSLKRLNWHFPFGDFLRQPRLMEDYLEPFRDAVEQFARTPPEITAQAILLWRILHTMILRYRLKHPEWTFVRHEDLSARPLEEFGKLFRTLRLRYSGKVRSTVAEYSAGDNPVEAAAGEVHQLKRNSLGNIWNWTHRLTRAEILRIRNGTEDIARNFYSAADWSPPVTAARKGAGSLPGQVLDGLRAAS
jgi:hypothetical protein